jgi:hypothetical protein
VGFREELMPFLISGDARTVYVVFGFEDLLAGLEDPTAHERDIARTRFFGSASDCEEHRGIWMDPRKTPVTHYSQGNMDAANLVLLFSQQEEEVKKVFFAYVDKYGVLSGLLIRFSKAPDRWMIGLIKNTNLLPNQRLVFIMTSFDPALFCQLDCSITEVSTTNNQLIRAIASPMLEKFIGQILLSNEQLHPAFDVIELFLQYALPQTEFLNNKELLQAFDEKMPVILTNEVLKLLQHHHLAPTPQQVLRCLEPESELYRLLNAFKPGENKTKDRDQLAMLLKLDELGLNQYQQSIRDDKEIMRNLVGFLNVINNQFLFACLTSGLNMKGLRFIMRMRCDRFRQIFLQLQDLASPRWQRLAEFADGPWDPFQIAVISGLIINLPTVSQSWLMVALNSFNDYPSLRRDFDPFEFVDFLIVLARLNEIGFGQYHILTKYEDAAHRRRQSLPLYAQILSTLGKYCLQDPTQAQLIDLLEPCDSPEQIDAGCTLLELGYTKKVVSAFIQKPFFVSAINWLKKNNLTQEISNVLTKQADFLILTEKLYAPHEYRAGLVLFAQGQLDASEILKLGAVFAQFPKLASLIESLHGRRVPGQWLKRFAFNPLQHQAVALLSKLNIDFSLEQLTPVACQLTIAIAGMLKFNPPQELKVNANNYLRSVLPLVLQTIHLGGKVHVCIHHIDFQRLLFEENGTLASTSFITQLRHLLTKQLLVLLAARTAGVPEAQQLMKTGLIADELARAVSFLAIRCEEQSKENPRARLQQAVLYQQLFAGFAALDENFQVIKNSTIMAVEILIDCHLRDPQTSIVPLDLLLKKPLMLPGIRELSSLDFPHLHNTFKLLRNNEAKALQFCQVVVKIKKECDLIKDRLKKEEAKEKYNSFVKQAKAYRQSMYQAIYEEFDPAASLDQGKKKTLAEKISAAEAHINDVVEIDRHPWLRIAMNVICNFVTIIFTAGHLNKVHQQKTGDWLFYARPASSEEVRRFDREIMDEVKTVTSSEL